MKILYLFVGLLLFMALFFNCSESITDQPHENLPPETELFIQSADTLNQTTSVQTMYWDGRDADGFVVGYYYTWQDNPGENDWTFTTDRSMEFPLQITGTDTNYTFQVKAIDDGGLEDPTPAAQLIPIKNSPPVISWTLISNIPDTTFTVAAFIWSVQDLDGENTIASFEYALDDTTQWKTIAGFKRELVLNADSGLVAGDHAFYIRAVDIAGSRSNVIRMPDNPLNKWHVKEPKGQYLLIDDFANETGSGSPDAYYKSMMDNIVVPNGGNYDYWNIEELFPASTLQFSETMKLFDYVLWYTDVSTETDEHLIAAQIAIPEFRNNGGKLIYTTMFDQGFGAQGDPLSFSPVEELLPPSGVYRSFPGSVYLPDSSFTAEFPNLVLPELKVSHFVAAMKAFVPKANALILYRSDAAGPATTGGLPIFTILGKNDNTGVYDFLFSGAPLHQLRGNNNLDQFFDIIFNDVFTSN